MIATFHQGSGLRRRMCSLCLGPFAENQVIFFAEFGEAHADCDHPTERAGLEKACVISGYELIPYQLDSLTAQPPAEFGNIGADGVQS